MLRILKVNGRTAIIRKARLAMLQAWMEDAGWELMDYSAELGSAAFERNPDAPPLPRFHGTRWLSSPDWYRPRNLLRVPGGVSRGGVVAAMVGVAMVGGMMGLLYFSHTGSTLSLTGDSSTPAEPWQYVDANMLNIREHPLNNAQIVGVLYRNQRVEVKSIEDGWAELLKPERGYVASKFLKTHPVQ